MYGEDVELGISFQNSYGTQLQNSVWYVPILSENLSPAIEVPAKQSLRGVYDEGALLEGTRSVESDIEVEAHPVTLGVLLKAALGDPVSTQVESWVTQHVYTPPNDDFDAYAARRPMTITKNLGVGSAMRFYDMIGGGIQLSITNGELLRVTLSVIGGKWDQVAPPSASFLADAQWQWDVTSLGIVGGAAVEGVKSLNINITQPMANHYTLGQGNKFPSHTKRDGFRVTEIDGTILFADQTEFQQFMSQTERHLQFFMRGVTAIQSGYYDELNIDLPAFRYTAYPIDVGGPGMIEVGFNGKAAYHPGSGTSSQITLQNTASGY